jgi:hypothetical protein
LLQVYAAVVIAKGEPFPAEPLTMALLLLSQHKIIDWLTKQISKHESLSNNKEVKRSKEEKQELGRENKHDYIIRKNDGRIHYIDDY